MALNTTDYSSNSNNLTNSGITEYTTSRPFTENYTAANLDGGDYAYISDASQTGLNLTSTFTIEFWLRLHDASNYPTIVAKDDNVGIGTRAYNVLLYPDNKIRIIISDGVDKYDYYRYDTAVEIDEWHHWAITCNVGNASATTFEFFKDGTSVGNGTSEIAGNCSAIVDTSAQFSIGAVKNNGTEAGFLIGQLDDVRVWNDVRTSTEISNNYQKHLTGTEAGLVAYYPFEEISTKATGGAITTSGDYKVHTFLADGTFTPSESLTVDALIVAGGGSGGYGGGGGGGAGGVIELTDHAVTAQAYTITVGDGGTGLVSPNVPGSGTTNGEDSVFDEETAEGGGCGGTNGAVPESDGQVGGSGGGGGANGSATSLGGDPTSGQGNHGGGNGGNTASPYPGGGGGGAGATGNSASGTTAGDGGAGIESDIDGTAKYYGGGGGGGCYLAGTAGSGGSDIGGDGNSNTGAGTAGTDGRGGGGGGSGTSITGGDGGSGIVIIRYLEGGTVTSASLPTLSPNKFRS